MVLGVGKMKKVAETGCRIKEYREIHNLTLSDMETITGIPSQTLNRYELGQRKPKSDVVTQIAEKLNINPLWLFGYDEDIALFDEKKLKDKAIAMLLENIAKLTPENREKLADYLALLLQSQK